MAELIFCGNSKNFLKEELTKKSNEENGGAAFRIPSIIKSGDNLIAVIDRQTSGADWGYIELATRISKDGGKTWSPVKTIAKPPARETILSADSYASSFFLDPCMAIAPNGDVIMIVDFFPECKGIHNKRILEKHKLPYAMLGGRMRPLIYDRDGKVYYIDENGEVLDNFKAKTEYTVKDFGALYKNDEYVGNIYLNGKTGKNEADMELTFGAPLKSPKRNYVFMLRSTDNGETWSKPTDITNMILHDDDGVFLGVAPGVGITTQDNRIIMPLYVDRKENVSIYSVDNGETWHRMTQHAYAANIDEWQMIEAPNGNILGFGRQKRYGKTPVSISTNSGKSWDKCKKTSLYAPKCQKSIIRVNDYVFCSHPGERTRSNGILSIGKLIKKDGVYSEINWIKEVDINKGFFAYSCLVQIDDDTLGILYESEPSSYILFDTFTISKLIDSK